MDYNKLTTDELILIITSKVGVPLPIYDYNINKYVSKVPENISEIIVYGARGVENVENHDTFRESCMRIINWDDKKN